MSDVVKFIEDNKVSVICRGYYGDDLRKVITALHKGGVRMAEVTFDQADPDAIAKTCGAIRMIREEFPDMKVGSGTVRARNCYQRSRRRILSVTECKY